MISCGKNFTRKPLLRILPTLLLALFLALFLVTIGGCAGQSQHTRNLLVVDYQQLTDDELLLHYYDLEDQIFAAEQKSSAPRLSFGLGLGSFGGSTSVGAGVGVSTDMPRSSEPAAELRDRRKLVRLELQKRNITP